MPLHCRLTSPFHDIFLRKFVLYTHIYRIHLTGITISCMDLFSTFAAVRILKVPVHTELIKLTIRFPFRYRYHIDYERKRNDRLISGFHRAFFKVNHFYWPNNALNSIKLRDYNLRCINFKRQSKTIKNHSDMFRIVCDPSSGSA